MARQRTVVRRSKGHPSPTTPWQNARSAVSGGQTSGGGGSGGLGGGGGASMQMASVGKAASHEAAQCSVTVGSDGGQPFAKMSA